MSRPLKKPKSFIRPLTARMIRGAVIEPTGVLARQPLPSGASAVTGEFS